MNFTTSNFTTKDSGKREQFTSGMVRDTQDGKTNFALVFSGPMLERWAALLTRGAVKYERDNWMKASGPAELQRFQESAARHFAQWMRGDTDEDHAAAVYFNLNGAEFVKERMREESDCEAIERWNRVPLRELYEDKLKEATADLVYRPPGSGPMFKTGMSKEMLREWRVVDECHCDTCDDTRELRNYETSSTPGQVREPSVRPVDNA